MKRSIINNRSIGDRTMISRIFRSSNYGLSNTIRYFFWQRQRHRQQFYYYSSSCVVKNATTAYDNELIVSILGPPNAGKSTLFNRLMDKGRSASYKLSSDKKSKRIKRKHYSRNTVNSKYMGSGNAIVSPTPGTTRDRKECWGRIGETKFRLMDTAGIDGTQILSKEILQQQMLHQTWEAARQADLILLVMDARIGILSSDYMAATTQWLRRARKKTSSSDRITSTALKQTVVLVANKLEGDGWDYDGSPIRDGIIDASRLGFGHPINLSAIHGDGISDLALVIEKAQNEKRTALEALLSNDDDNDDLLFVNNNDGDEEEMDNNYNSEIITKTDHEESDHLHQQTLSSPILVKIAILGRTNVGKSTLVNSLLGMNRVISGPTPGLTRDSIATDWKYDKNTRIQLVDTAGIRKNCEDPEEEWAVQDAFRAMKVADVAILVLDAAETKLHKHELAIADAVVKEGRALIIVANKQDLLVTESYTSQEFGDAVRNHLETRLPMLRQTPIVPLSSLHETSEDIQHRLMPLVVDAKQRWSRTISTGLLNRWLKEVIIGHPPPRQRNRPTKLKYIIQTKGRPPTFLLYTNQPTLTQSYVRYLARNFQETFDYFGMEIRILIKYDKTNNPFHKKSMKSKKTSSGIGGKEARMARRIHELKTTGLVQKKRKRKPRQQDPKQRCYRK
mmetsp:Transcript_11349/g.12679  ORF Transcript_11349/g.12679 Transcript_11349/m.12679 type:complete len:677 (+) Transcript_11349:34-2064(+)